MKIHPSLVIVIFGAMGNLYSDKLAKALYLLFLKGELPQGFDIVAFARKDLTDQDFRTLTKENILKRGKIDSSRLDDFLGHITYFKGDFSQKDDFIKLRDFITKSSAHTKNQVLLHIATASQLYEKIFENILYAGLSVIADKVKILIEKPFGKNETDAMNLQHTLTGIFKEENIFHIDHYLAKETVRGIFDFRWDKSDVEKIKIIFHESNLVGSRGASYDMTGAFRDVGQNHMLQLLALAVMEKSSVFNAESMHTYRKDALNDLYIDPKDYRQKITRGQYEGYKSGPGINPHSETETFFRVFLQSKNLNFSGVVFELEGGKGLADMHSDITPTTVAVQIYFKDGQRIQKKELKIQPVPGAVYESYTKVYSDALKGDQTNFPSIEEIVAEWKIADELLEKRKNVPMVIYKKGSKAEDIF